ncbi:MAG TPA: BON domain-containing protein [Candidatus Acidoferrales bacterium]|nr:BON domain-containing protein [Candidatus Acidoferrales bacterium]
MKTRVVSIAMLLAVFWAMTMTASLALFAQAPPQAMANASPGPLIPALPAYSPKTKPANEQERIAREVRHELVMQNYYTIWDFLAFRMDGNTVELYGDVVRPVLKSDAENAVKRIEGVEKVVNNINVLPPFPSDDRIRREVAQRIFSFGGLSRYSWSAVPSLHIIVGGGHVKLEGVVDNQADKDAAGIQANSVPGVFSVKNELMVASNKK